MTLIKKNTEAQRANAAQSKMSRILLWDRERESSDKWTDILQNLHLAFAFFKHLILLGPVSKDNDCGWQ